MRAGLVDLLDISVHPMFLGSGSMLVRDDLSADLTLVGTKVFSRIVKLSYAVSPPRGNDGYRLRNRPRRLADSASGRCATVR